MGALPGLDLLCTRPGAGGAVAEWSKALAWKVSIRQNRIEGSNPSRSATRPKSLENKGEVRARTAQKCAFSVFVRYCENSSGPPNSAYSRAFFCRLQRQYGIESGGSLPIIALDGK
jgi:hypothetical protein